MESIIVFTNINLFEHMNNKLAEKKDWQVFKHEDSINFLFKEIKLIVVYEIKIEDTINPPQNTTVINRIFAINYNDINALKLFIRYFDYSESWINNDFDGINYSYSEFVLKMARNENWDWRIN